MICGLHIKYNISIQEANYYTHKFDLVISNHARSLIEKQIGDNTNSYKRTGKYRNLIIELTCKNQVYTLNLRGSIHKFYKGENRGSFTGTELLFAINELCDVFSLEKEKVLIQNFEVGINLPVWFNINEYLKSNLSYHKKEYWRNSKGMFVYEHTEYLLKLYDKSLKTEPIDVLNNPKKSILRFEKKFVSAKKLRDFGITTLVDFTIDKVNMLADDLKSEWNEILMRDSIVPSMMSNDEWQLIDNFASTASRQVYSDALKVGDSKKKDALRQSAYRLKNKCVKIIGKYGDNTHQKLGVIINDLINEFKNTWNESVTILDLIQYKPVTNSIDRYIDEVKINTKYCKRRKLRSVRTHPGNSLKNLIDRRVIFRRRKARNLNLINNETSVSVLI